MSIGLLFWVIMIMWLLFGIWQNAGNRFGLGGHIIAWILFGLLGWRAFGPILRN